jgi:hypothetical protein
MSICSRFLGILALLTITTSVHAEIYKVFPRSIDAYIGSRSGPFLGVGSNLYDAQMGGGTGLSSVGPIVYDANINASGTGTLVLPTIFFTSDNVSRLWGDLALYPYGFNTYTGIKFKVNGGTFSVTNGVIQGLTASFYEGTFVRTTFPSRMPTYNLREEIDFSAHPATLALEGGLRNGPWGLPYDNASLFFDEDPFDNPPGVTGANLNDTESAGIHFFGLSGEVFSTTYFTSPIGGGIQGIYDIGLRNDSFYMQFAATVPEAGTTTLLAIVGGLGIVGWGTRRLRTPR